MSHEDGGPGPAVVFAAYRPKPGGAERLLQIVRGHLPALRKLGLVTDRKSTLVRAKDGTLIEVFEWIDGGAANRAHHAPEVQAIWRAMDEVGEFPALQTLPEFQARFPHFTPVD